LRTCQTSHVVRGTRIAGYIAGIARTIDVSSSSVFFYGTGKAIYPAQVIVGWTSGAGVVAPVASIAICCRTRYA
jgi:hypothetical protein